MASNPYGDNITKSKMYMYTPEFKVECALLVLDQGCSVKETAQSMGVGESTLGKWVAKLKKECDGVVSDGRPITEEQREIFELKKRIQRLELEKDILKKASALLMSDSMNGLR